MLTLAIVVLVVLVASALWLLLRPPLPATEQGEQPAPDADDPTESLGHPDVRVVDPHHGDERALRH